MKRFGLFLLAVVMVAGLAGCSGGGDDSTGPTPQEFALEGVTYAPSYSGNYTYVRGVVRNLTSNTFKGVRVFCKAYTTGDVVLDEVYKTFSTVNPNEALSFEVMVETRKQPITRWEHRVEHL